MPDRAPTPARPSAPARPRAAARPRAKAAPIATKATLPAAPPAVPPITLGKRAFDLGLSLVLVALLWPIILATALVLLVAEGRPVFYLSERSAAPGARFRLYKFRTMQVGADANGGVTGGDKAHRMSRLHRLLRRTRIDELPQLWNVLKGDMSLVGPRPPDPRYVELYPDIYGAVLRCRPGVTGLATIVIHEWEERMLHACRTPEDTERTYRRRCIPRKARIDLIYQRRRSLRLDLWLIARTALRPFRGAAIRLPAWSRPQGTLDAPSVPAE